MPIRSTLPLALILAALSLDGCGVEDSAPAPVVDQDKWGHLPPDPERPQQAEQTDLGRG